MKTSGRILEQARKLFNEQGVAAVSTADIAHALGISPGNLYYHFQNKQDLLIKLCEQCHQRLRPILDMVAIGQASWHELEAQLLHLLEILAEFVFILQDSLQICRLNPKLRHRLQWMRQHIRDSFNEVLAGYVEHGVLPKKMNTQLMAEHMTLSCWFAFADQALHHPPSSKHNFPDVNLAFEHLLKPLSVFML